MKETIQGCIISRMLQLTLWHILYICRLTEDCVQKVSALEGLDVCSQQFSFSRSEEAVRSQCRRMLCDVVMDQAVMPGVGNIIKNEALFDSGLHPAVKVGEKK